MKIRDLLKPESIRLNSSAASKDEVLRSLVDLMAAGGNISSKQVYLDGVRKREQEASTAVGDGVAIPHCRSEAVSYAGLAAMTLPAGVDYDAPDGEKVRVIFLIAAPATGGDVHIDALSKLSTMLLNEDFTKNLLAAQTVDEFLSAIDKAESEKDSSSDKKTVPSDMSAASSVKMNILAVTACPTGIAHTYMAAEMLEKTAAKFGVAIKVETRGASGVKNELKAADIAKADCVIIAADTHVPLERFDGKPLVQCKVGDGINKADTLIQDALGGKYPVFHAPNDNSAGIAAAKASSKESTAHTIYKHLMNGVSYMLPIVVGGGILIAIAFLIDGLLVDLNSMPFEQRSSFGSITSAARLFKTIGGGAFGFMLPILAGFIAMSIADRPGLAAGLVGGYLASQGRSGFIGALIAGFAAGYIVLFLKKAFAKLPKMLDGLKPILFFPLFGIAITGTFMQFIVEPPIGVLNTMCNTALAGMSGTGSIILGILLGGMMAVDMGGPINKAAYVFGSASIAAGNYNIMAAVMIGGMVPPLAIAISSLLFKSKYTPAEYKAAPANIVMGLSFITEGAIPFAASDPLHVLPCCIAGSALAGGISMAANCTLMAPHGGIFVFPVVGHPFFYLAALLAGSFAAAILLGLTKKTVQP
ncbi:MAG: PTS fructose transporter subunit IIABC [Treponema sp.]